MVVRNVIFLRFKGRPMRGYVFWSPIFLYLELWF